MKRTTGVIATFSVVAALYAGFLYWRQGEPYQPPYKSPNGQYTIQKYLIFRVPNLFTGPGQGSDGAGGYIRLYDRNGKMLKERRQDFFRDITPVWAGKEVFLKGVAEMDNDPWILPSSST